MNKLLKYVSILLGIAFLFERKLNNFIHFRNGASLAIEFVVENKKRRNK
jgi:hypothetical protein